MGRLSNDVVIMGVIVDDTTTFTLTQVRQHYNIQEELFQEMVEYGLIVPVKNEPEPHLNIGALRRLQSALHLYDDLGVNMPGVALALDLMEELDKAQSELEILHKHLRKV